MDSYARDAPRQSTGKWRMIFADARFEHLTASPPVRPGHAGESILRSRPLDQLHCRLPKEEQDIVRAEVIDLIAGEPLLADKESVQFPYVTELHLFKKRA